jgi:hypothetical protein
MNGDVLARRLLDRTVAREVLGSTRPYRDAAALIFDRDDGRQVIFESMDWEHPGRRNYWQRNQRLIAQAVPLEEALVEDPIQVMFNGGVDAMRLLAGALRNAASSAPQSGPTSQRRPAVSRSDTTFRETGPREARSFAVSLTEYVHRDFSLIDITAPEATKGRALAWRAAQLALGPDEVMAIGDNFNDLEMLQFAGTPVVMANAVDGLKDFGWHVTGHQDEAGLAEAIRKFAL